MYFSTERLFGFKLRKCTIKTQFHQSQMCIDTPSPNKDHIVGKNDKSTTVINNGIYVSVFIPLRSTSNAHTCRFIPFPPLTTHNNLYNNMSW